LIKPFGNFNFLSTEEASIKIEGDCYLKTKEDKLKKYYAIVKCFELFCYRNNPAANNDTPSKLMMMHTLKGVYVKKLEEEVWVN
jgi:hypothetical protein